MQFKKLMEGVIQTWYQPSILTKVLMPLSRIYEKGMTVRKRYLQKHATRFQIPIIIVGNITVGGTGKTPLLMALYDALKQAGYQPGIISRGYQGQLSSEFPTLVKDHHGPEEIGDEPFMVFKRTRAPLMICRDRVKAIEALQTIMPSINVILSDDGLQHYQLARDIEIAVIDGDRRFGNGQLLPAGPLREPIARLKDVDFIVCQGQPQKNEYGMKLVGDTLYALNNSQLIQSLQSLKSVTVHAVAGIGNPDRFFKDLSEQGVTVIPHAFPDHHPFQAGDFESFNPLAPIIMTEKDAVKCTQLPIENAWYLSVSAKIDPKFIEDILRKLSHG